MSAKSMIDAAVRQRRESKRWREVRALLAACEARDPVHEVREAHRIIPGRHRTSEERSRLEQEPEAQRALLEMFIERAASVPGVVGHVELHRRADGMFFGFAQSEGRVGALPEGRNLYTFTLSPLLVDAPGAVIEYLALGSGIMASPASDAWPSKAGMAVIRRILADEGELPFPPRVDYTSTKPHFDWAYRAAANDERCLRITGMELDPLVADWLDQHDPRVLIPTWRTRLRMQQERQLIWPA